jgi:hypothetical protein
MRIPTAKQKSQLVFHSSRKYFPYYPRSTFLLMINLPKSRQSEMVVQASGKELLVYDLLAHKAFCLNETSMIVFEACAEGKTFEDLKQDH